MDKILTLEEEKKQKIQAALDEWDRVDKEYQEYLKTLDDPNIPFDVDEMFRQMGNVLRANKKYHDIDNKLNNTHEKNLQEEIEDEIKKRAAYGYWEHGLELVDEDE